MVHKVFPGSKCFQHCLYLPGFYLVLLSDTPEGVLKSSHSFAASIIYSKRVASGSINMVHLTALSDIKNKEKLIFQKARTWNLSFCHTVHMQHFKFYLPCFLSFIYLQETVPTFYQYYRKNHHFSPLSLPCCPLPQYSHHVTKNSHLRCKFPCLIPSCFGSDLS